MIEEIFTRLALAMNGRFEIAFLAAAGWGATSVILSPCHLSSVPLVIGYLAARGDDGLRRPYALSVVFALGILTTIGLIGVITSSAGRMLGDVGVWGSIIVAGVFFVVGLSLLDLIRLPWNGISPPTTHGGGWRGALMLGLVFGIGLGPCTFAFMAPVLAVVFTVAGANPLRALLLTAGFGIGHCAVIVVAGGAAGSVQKYLNWTGRSNGALWIKRAAGSLVIAGGAYYVYTAF